MRLILITRPEFFSGESALIARMFEDGLPILHIRKPQATAAEMERFIVLLPEEYRSRMVVHSHYELVPQLGLRGAHLGRGRTLPQYFPRGIPMSYSCHSIEEVVAHKQECDYVFLSPIFNSISKKGYLGAFTEQALREARQRGIIDERVIALGGVTPQHLPQLRAWGFGGGAILGDVWQSPDPVAELQKAILWLSK